MDADDVAYPQRLERQVRFLQEHPDIDLLGAGAVVFKGAGEVFGRYPTACTHEDICRRPWWGFPSPIQPGWANGGGLRHTHIVKDTRDAKTKIFSCEAFPRADLPHWKRCCWGIESKGCQYPIQ